MTKQRAALLFVLFIALEVVLYRWVDLPMSDYMRTVESSNPALIDFFRAITDYAKSVWYLWPSGIGIIICAVLLRLRHISGRPRSHVWRTGHGLLFLFASIAVSGLITDALKPLFGRARPVEMLHDNAYGFDPWTFTSTWNGMPSGHATTAAALATALCLLYPRGRIVWILIGFILAHSRVMVNAHYLSDVVAGSVIGTVTALAFWHYRNHRGMFHLMKGIFPIDKPTAKA